MSRYPIILLFCFILGISTNSFSQSIVRSSLSCLGSTSSGEGFILRQTIGQSSNTVVVNNSELVLRQGFQQPISFQLIYDILIPIEFTLSPNPAKEKTLLQINEQISTFNIIISNLNGTPIIRIPGQNLLDTWLDLRNFSSGIYIITIISDKKTGSKKLIVLP